MTPGQIVMVDWRDAKRGSSEPSKRRPAIIVGAERFFSVGLPVQIVVPLTGDESLAIPDASLTLDPTPENGCTKRSWAIAWNVSSVSHARLTETTSYVTSDQLRDLRACVRNCVS